MPQSPVLMEAGADPLEMEPSLEEATVPKKKRFNKKVDDFCSTSAAFFLMCSGATGELPVHKTASFFKPYPTVGQGFFRASSILIAPIALTLLGVELVLVSIFMAFKAIADLITGDLKTTKDSAESTLVLFCMGGLSVLAAVISPILNLVDVVGSLVKSGKVKGKVATVEEKCEFSETDTELKMPPSTP